MASKPRVYIGRLPARARESDVERFFRGYGKVRDIMLKNGFGFVELDDYRDADDAIRDLDGRELCGERVQLEIAKGIPRGAGGAFVSGYVPPPSSSRYYSDRDRRRGGGDGRSSSSGRPGFGRPSNGYKVIIENLSAHCNWQDLKEMCEEYGEILYADAHHYRRNEAVVEFAKRGDMEYAVEKLNGKAVNGKRMKLLPEQDRYSKSPSPPPPRESRSRSRERSRRHSSRRSNHSRSRSPIERRRPSPEERNGRSRSGSNDRYERRRSRSGSRSSRGSSRSA